MNGERKRPPPRQRERVLIVEDNKEAADSLAALLRLGGYDVRVCYDGASAITEAEEWTPAAAIVDIGLPGLSGYAVAEQIRALPFGRGVLLIALTAYAHVEDMEEASYAGFNWHICKPAGASVIAAVLQNPWGAATLKDAVFLN